MCFGTTLLFLYAAYAKSIAAKGSLFEIEGATYITKVGEARATYQRSAADRVVVANCNYVAARDFGLHETIRVSQVLIESHSAGRPILVFATRRRMDLAMELASGIAKYCNIDIHVVDVWPAGVEEAGNMVWRPPET